MSAIPEAQLPTFAIILPVYNEESIIADCVGNIDRFLKKALTVVVPIITVNDGSKDNTLAILSALKKDIPNLVVVDHVQNAGYGQACRTGLHTALNLGLDYGLVMDADGTQDPKFILDFFTPMRAGVDMIKATRYSKGGKTVGVGWQRKAPSYVGNKLAKYVHRLPISDYTNGFRALKTSLIKQLDTKENGFSLLIEEVVCAKKLGASFAEVPYTLTVREEEGGSKFVYSWKIYRNYLKQLLQ